MSVERRVLPSGAVTFYVRWRENGRPRSRSFAAARLGGERAARRAAEQYDREVARALLSGEFAPTSQVALTVRDAVMDWVPSAAPRLSAGTRRQYAQIIDLYILPRLGDVALAQLTPADVEDWAAELVREGVGAPTARKASTVLSGVLQRAVRARHLQGNPVRDAVLPSAKRTRAPMFIEPGQVEAMRSWMRDRGHVGDALVVSLLAYAGLRPESEAWPLTWGAIGAKTIHVAAGGKRGAHDRYVPLLRPLADDLAEWRELCTSQMVLPFADGHVAADGAQLDATSWRNWRKRVWLPAAAAAGVAPGSRPRDLRGSFATLLIHEGRTIIEIAAALGHAPSMTLDTYASAFAEHDRRNQVSATTAIRRAREQQSKGLRVVA